MDILLTKDCDPKTVIDERDCAELLEVVVSKVKDRFTSDFRERCLYMHVKDCSAALLCPFHRLHSYHVPSFPHFLVNRGLPFIATQAGSLWMDGLIIDLSHLTSASCSMQCGSTGKLRVNPVHGLAKEVAGILDVGRLW